MTLLTIHDDIAGQIAADALRYNPSLLSGPAFLAESTVSAGYTDVTSIANWDKFWGLVGLSYRTFRNGLIDDFVAQWGTLSDANKAILVSHYVYPAATGNAELNTHWPSATRKAQRKRVRQELRKHYTVRKSSTSGSKKFFRIKVDDAGVITATEITPDVSA